MTVTPDHTVSQVAEILQRSRSSVTSLIESGLLVAYDASPDGKYRQWRVTPQALDEFRRKNSAKQKPTRRGRVAKSLKEYV